MQINGQKILPRIEYVEKIHRNHNKSQCFLVLVEMDRIKSPLNHVVFVYLNLV